MVLSLFGRIPKLVFYLILSFNAKICSGYELKEGYLDNHKSEVEESKYNGIELFSLKKN